MKIEKSKFIILIILLIILGIMPQAYAKTSIEIKPNTEAYTYKTISQFFDETMAMKNIGEGLEGSNVDVHMATNTEWAIFAYFSNSQYGTNGEGENKGKEVTIGSTTYKSTNGNVTGMMNLGATATYTAGVITNFDKIENTDSTEEPYDWGKSIIEKAKNEEYQYVDLINSVSAKAMAGSGWYKTVNFIGDDCYKPFSIRVGLFELVGGIYNPRGSADPTPTGKPMTSYTFRPVIWNKLSNV